MMRFVSTSGRITSDMVEQAYLSGFDRVPWQVRVRHGNGELLLERPASDSGNLHIPWRVEGYGQVMLSTATLMERPQAYHLPLELARGKLGQLRNQLAEWQMVGLEVPARVQDKLAEALGYFAQAAVIDHASERSVRLADEAVRHALNAADSLVACYTEQVIAVRRRATPKLPTLLGVDLGPVPLAQTAADRVVQAFNAAAVPLAWRRVEATEGHYDWEAIDRQVQWCRAEGLRVALGPILQFDRSSFPDWLALYDDDVDSLFSLATEFVKTAVLRYRGQVDLWQSAGRINSAERISLPEEVRVRLAARTIELCRRLDAKTPVVVSFDQPWAEYLSRHEMEYPPLHSADTLVRADLGLTGLALEINVGYHPGGTLLRDLLEFSRQLDYWSLLGVPLFVTVCAPSSIEPDRMATRRTGIPGTMWTPKAQALWVARYLPLLLAKPYLHGVFWGQLHDAQPHEFPHGGLFDAKGQPKPALRQLAAIRKSHLR
jgi:hypothetical protein